MNKQQELIERMEIEIDFLQSRDYARRSLKVMREAISEIQRLDRLIADYQMKYLEVCPNCGTETHELNGAGGPRYCPDESCAWSSWKTYDELVATSANRYEDE